MLLWAYCLSLLNVLAVWLMNHDTILEVRKCIVILIMSVTIGSTFLYLYSYNWCKSFTTSVNQCLRGEASRSICVLTKAFTLCMKSDRIVSRGHSRPCQYSKAMCLITMTCSDDVFVSVKRFFNWYSLGTGIHSMYCCSSMLQPNQCSLS